VIESNEKSTIWVENSEKKVNSKGTGGRVENRRGSSPRRFLIRKIGGTAMRGGQVGEDAQGRRCIVPLNEPEKKIVKGRVIDR